MSAPTLSLGRITEHAPQVLATGSKYTWSMPVLVRWNHGSSWGITVLVVLEVNGQRKGKEMSFFESLASSACMRERSSCKHTIPNLH